MQNRIQLTLLIAGLICLECFSIHAQNILIFEDFETGDFEAKGWYDGFPDQRTTAEFKNGAHSYEGHFAQGATSSGAGRHLFEATDKVYISYWVKYSSNYIGSGVGYHPHEWNILTDKDWIYQGPADTYLTTYIEQNAGRPILALQDSKNVDPNCILLNNNSIVGCNGDFDSYTFSEDRSVCSCNGLIGDVDRRDCFVSSGSTHGYYSSRAWAADSIYFRNTPGPYFKNDWHKIEAYFEMNTIEQGVGIPNGKIRYWYDGQVLIASDSILMRTAANADMKFNQLFYGGYIGVGSPIEQSWWVDDLVIADGIPTVSSNQFSVISNDFKIFPNPNDGVFTVELSGTGHIISDVYTIAFFNTFGEKVHEEKMNATVQSFDIDLPSGIYYCYIKDQHNLRALGKMCVID